MHTVLDTQSVFTIFSKSGTTDIRASHREVTEASRGLRHYSKLTHQILTGKEFYTKAYLVPHRPSLYISQHHKSRKELPQTISIQEKIQQ